MKLAFKKIELIFILIITGCCLTAVEYFSYHYVQQKIMARYDSLFKNPCFYFFHKEHANTQKKIYLDTVKNPYQPGENGFQLDNYSSKNQNTINNVRKTCGTNISKSPSRNVYFFGGSTIEGIGVNDCNTIPSFFQNANPTYKVHNMGVRGNMITMEEKRFSNLNFEKNSLVIFLDGLNENFYDYNEDLLASQTQKNQNLLKIIKKSLHQLNTVVAFSYLLEKELPPHTKIETCQSKTSKDIPINKELKISSNEIANRYTSSVKRIQNQCNSRRLDCHFFIQPIPSYQYSKELYFNDTKGGFTNRQVEYEYFVKTIFNKKTINIYNISASLLDVDRAYLDKVHYSSRGNQVIAEQINNLLRKQYIKLGAPPPNRNF